MSTLISPPGKYLPGGYLEDDIWYPDDDGQDMGDGSAQFDWIALLHQNLKSLFAHRSDVVIAGNMLWYPLRGENKLCRAPDVMVIFGPPRQHRGSYLQWVEGGFAPQVTFEIQSPANSVRELADKLVFYDRHGVEEYYLYHPETRRFSAWIRSESGLKQVVQTAGFVSPRLQIRFENTPDGLMVFRPDGMPFRELADVDEDLAEADQKVAEADQRLAEADQKVALAKAELEMLRQQLRQAGLEPGFPR